MKGRLIEEGFTLPEGSEACRRGYDVPVPMGEYRRLQNVHEKVSPTAPEQIYADMTRITGKTAKDAKLIVTRGKGPKAALASSLREWDAEKGSQTRIEKIGRKIIDAIISDFKTVCTLDVFLCGDMPFADSQIHIDDIQVSSMDWADGEEGHDAPRSPNKDQRKNFLYELQRLVETEVNIQMRELLKVEFNGESIWDDLEVKVNLNNSQCDSNGINADVFFAGREEEGEG